MHEIQNQTSNCQRNFGKPSVLVWLKDRITEIQSIVAGTTRKKVNQVLLKNGGIPTPTAAIYSSTECSVLKVRIEFEATQNDNERFPFNEDDKVKAVSMPYLGFFTWD